MITQAFLLSLSALPLQLEGQGGDSPPRPYPNRPDFLNGCVSVTLPGSMSGRWDVSFLSRDSRGSDLSPCDVELVHKGGNTSQYALSDFPIGETFVRFQRRWTVGDGLICEMIWDCPVSGIDFGSAFGERSAGGALDVFNIDCGAAEGLKMVRVPNDREEVVGVPLSAYADNKKTGSDLIRQSQHLAASFFKDPDKAISGMYMAKEDPLHPGGSVADSGGEDGYLSVRLEEGYCISASQVTVAQWNAYLSATGKPTGVRSVGQRGGSSAAGMTYDEAMAYCGWLTERVKSTGLVGFEIRLPTEIEWELAMAQPESANSAPAVGVLEASLSAIPETSQRITKGSLQEWTYYRFRSLRPEWEGFPKAVMEEVEAVAKERGSSGTLLYSPFDQVPSRYSEAHSDSDRTPRGEQSWATVKGSWERAPSFQKDFNGYRRFKTTTTADQNTGFRVVMVRVDQEGE